ncbi:MAG: exodeoxyribonuclease V subunit beta [Gammaproteobacteria bacterium]|nr:exodeoxyribonuclease V subunit beta [Gammaproteobacteria bacterium]
MQTALLSEQGEALSERLRQRYPVALIDEFQDTDPIQFDIFRKLYLEANLPVFWVGDPKQAIYSFRGADIFAYLEARQQADQCHTLQVNWRSQAGLLSAVSALFSSVDKPFLYNDINFPAVMAAESTSTGLQLRGEDGNELHLWWLNDEEDQEKEAKKESLNKNQAEEKVSALISAEIQQLLSLGQEEQALIDGRPLNGADIAILVRTHRQAAVVREHLLLRGISSVQQSPRSVFQSEEAVALEWVLLAISQPHRSGWVKAALATDLLGLSALELHGLAADEQAWEQQQSHFYEANRLWQNRGFMPMMHYWMQYNDVAQRLLRLPDGQRRLTNLRHLMELLQGSREAALNMEVLLHYFSQRRLAESPQDEHQLRLENDENLVRIVTVHKSKGLEYGVVFCPFLWGSMGVKPRQNRSTLDVTYHDHDVHQRRLALQESKDSMAVEQASEEALAEELRLLYVALTRAKYRCYLPWGNITGMEHSAAAYLLHQGKECKKTAAEDLYKDLENLAQQQSGMILSRPALAKNSILLETKSGSVPQVKKFKGHLYSNWRISSFSALFSHGSAATVESPDYDGTESKWLHKPCERLDRFGFPRGARAGQCLHHLFEHFDFSAPLEQAEPLIEKTLQLFRFDLQWLPVLSEWFEQMLHTPLNRDSGLALENLPEQARLNELEFYYPMATFSMLRFRQILQQHGSELEQRLAEQLTSRQERQVRGFMKGFIDLVFESEGQFYLLDYKSNYLGDEYADYRVEPMQESMLQEGYVAQYLIYALALHRYLRCRLADYDYECHFGGVYYLFLRGMNADAGQDEEQTGVFFSRPSLALMRALDDFFDGD